ncbi:hypothetical protein Taro_014464 [Colocasia esculenta]|uniref:Uncharacterized protein n=1 Tax=Colocasia esculenta TaxID=4460 RepID=A0A843UQ80_COLES|nr:hypothetical protein [Colocasia esculenta]
MLAPIHSFSACLIGVHDTGCVDNNEGELSKSDRHQLWCAVSNVKACRVVGNILGVAANLALLRVDLWL